MAVRLNGQKAAGITLNLNLNFTDLDEEYLLSIENAVLHAFVNRSTESPDATLQMSSIDFKLMMLGVTEAAVLLEEQRLVIDGDILALAKLAELFDQFDRRFPIVTPRK